MTDSIGLIGLGNMGSAMAKTLQHTGFHIIASDLDPEKRKVLADSIQIAENASEVCKQCQIVLLSLPGSPQVEAVVQDAFLPHARNNSLLLDTSTAAPDSSRRLHQLLATAGHQMLDIPVSGGPAGAANGSLLIMAGGESAALQRAEPILNALAASIVHCGGPGAGNTVKLINNLLCASHMALLGEALAIADESIIEPELLLSALNAGSGRSAISEIHAPRWVLSDTYDSGFSMALMRKDLRLALDMIEKNDLQLPLAESMQLLWKQQSQPLADSDDFTRMVQFTRELKHVK